MDGVSVGGKLEGEKEDVGTTTSPGSEAPRSGARVEEGGRAVGVEVGGPVAEPVRAEAGEGDVVGVAVIGAPVVDVVGGLVLVEEEEEEVEVGEEEEGVVQVEEGEDGVERSVDVLGASSESVVTRNELQFLWPRVQEANLKAQCADFIAAHFPPTETVNYLTH